MMRTPCVRQWLILSGYLLSQLAHKKHLKVDKSVILWFLSFILTKSFLMAPGKHNFMMQFRVLKFFWMHLRRLYNKSCNLFTPKNSGCALIWKLSHLIMILTLTTPGKNFNFVLNFCDVLQQLKVSNHKIVRQTELSFLNTSQNGNSLISLLETTSIQRNTHKIRKCLTSVRIEC